MCVASYGYGGLSGGGMEVVNGIHARQSQRSWSHVVRCRSIFRVRGDALKTPYDTAVQVCRSG